MTKRVLTGIKPTGAPHVGNYLGAIRPALALADQPDYQALYFIADYHALTQTHDRAALQHDTYEVAATWLACGLDPERCLFYRQSDVPEVFEATWIFNCFTPKGWMNKAHAYKAKVAENQASGEADVDAGVNMGIYEYPVLMAADIILYDTDLVPVGQDQQQHIEIARDIAQRINHNYGAELLRLPEGVIDEKTAVVPGLDGRKMSKSYNNTIPLFLPPKQLKKTVGRIVTDSSPPEAPKDPDSSLIFTIYKQLVAADKAAEMAARYRAGIGWGDAKAALFEVLDDLLREPRARFDDLMAHPARIDALLAEGAERARAVARPVLDRLRHAIGISRG